MGGFLHRIKQLSADHESGSGKILADIIRALLAYTYSKNELLQAFGILKTIDPAMVVVHHLLQELEPAIDSDFREKVRQYQERWSGIEAKVAANLINHLPTGSGRVITHSNSSMVQAVLKILATRGFTFHVLQTTSYPGGEGKLQADSLSRAGLAVTLINDDDIKEQMAAAEACLLGVDQYDQAGFVNKVGSTAMVEAACKAAVPVFVLGDARKQVNQITMAPIGSLFEYVPWQKGIRLLTGQKDYKK